MDRVDRDREILEDVENAMDVENAENAIEIEEAHEMAEIMASPAKRYTGIAMIDELLNDKKNQKLLGVGVAAAAGYFIYRALGSSNGEKVKPPIDKPPIEPPGASLSGMSVIIDPWGEGVGDKLDNAGRVNNCWPKTFYGAVVNQAMAKSLARELGRLGLNVSLTRTQEMQLPIAERARMIAATLKSNDIYVSIRHGFGASAVCEKDYGGWVVYPDSPSQVSSKSQRLATYINTSMPFTMQGRVGTYSQTSRGAFPERKTLNEVPDPLFDALRAYGSRMPVGVIIVPANLCDCAWQHRFFLSEHYGKDSDDAFVNIYASRMAIGIVKYLTEVCNGMI